MVFLPCWTSYASLRRQDHCIYLLCVPPLRARDQLRNSKMRFLSRFLMFIFFSFIVHSSSPSEFFSRSSVTLRVVHRDTQPTAWGLSTETVLAEPKVLLKRQGGKQREKKERQEQEARERAGSEQQRAVIDGSQQPARSGFDQGQNARFEQDRSSVAHAEEGTSTALFKEQA